MPLRLVKDFDGDSIPAREMQDKQVAQITGWDCDTYIGEIVVRYAHLIVSLSDRGSAWYTNSLSHDCRVRVLPNGIIKLEVFDNE